LLHLRKPLKAVLLFDVQLPPTLRDGLDLSLGPINLISEISLFLLKHATSNVEKPEIVDVFVYFNGLLLRLIQVPARPAEGV